MRRILLILITGMAAGVLSFAWVRSQCSPELAQRDGSDIGWLREEFDLTAEQFAAIEQLHAQYRPQCARHCAAIIEARERLRELEQEEPRGGELAAARRAVAELEAGCNTATREHLFKVSAIMPADEGRRFLRITEPHLAVQSHDGYRGPVR